MNRLVIIAFAIFILLGLAFVVYQNLPGSTPCPEGLEIVILNSQEEEVTEDYEVLVGEELSFKYASDSYGGGVEWDFGDGGSVNKVDTILSLASYEYANPGLYTVRLQTPLAHCGVKERQIQVIEETDEPVYEPIAEVKIKSASTVTKGKTIRFSLDNSEVENVQWRFNDPKDGNAEGNEVSYTYEDAGTYTVVANFSIGRRNGEATKEIRVINGGHSCPTISEQDFKRLLNGKTSFSKIKKYLKGGQSVPTTVNGKLSSIRGYCDDLSMGVSGPIRSVRFEKTGGCITKIIITE